MDTVTHNRHQLNDHRHDVVVDVEDYHDYDDTAHEHGTASSPYSQSCEWSLSLRLSSESETDHHDYDNNDDDDVITHTVMSSTSDMSDHDSATMLMALGLPGHSGEPSPSAEVSSMELQQHHEHDKVSYHHSHLFYQ